MASQKHVKIILPCANEGPWLQATVRSLLENTEYPSFEIVVSANGDTTTDFAFLDEPPYRERVRLLWSRESLGVANARNAGVEPGDAEYYVFLDAHCLVHRNDWLSRAVATLEDHAECSLVQPEIANFLHEQSIPPHGKIDPSSLRPHCVEYASRWHWPYDHPVGLAEMVQRPASQGVFEEMAGSGGAIFTSSRVFHRLGGFDGEVSGWFHETMDYCVRGWLLGHPMLVDPTIRFYHRGKIRVADLRSAADLYHGLLRTAYKYLSPRRRAIAEVLARRHLGEEAQVVLDRVREGAWLSERVRNLRDRVRDDDWLFSRFDIYEERFVG